MIFVGVGFLLAVSAMGLVAAALAVRNAERSLKLAGDRMERILEEEKARFLKLLSEERRSLRKDLERERARWAAELNLERQAHLDAELRFGQPDQMDPEFQREREEVLHDIGGSAPPARNTVAPPPAARGAEKPPRPTAIPETAASGLVPEPTVEKPRVGVWHPHPDDAVHRVPHSPEGRDAADSRTPASGGRRGGAPVEMFRRHYDKYLENYAGYVELAEGLHRKRGAGVEEREWKESLRRVMDGIERTTARLDILEEHNPGLATDDRVSRRVSVAQRHSRLGG